MTRSQPCPICRKPIDSFDIGVYCESLGACGLWPTSYKNLRDLASEEGFNEYFQKQFNRNEATFLKWKEVFDFLEIVGGMGCHHNVRVHLETQVLSITNLEDLVKLKALAKLCSKEFFNDESLLVVAWRRIMEVLEVAMLPPVVEKKKVRGKKNQKKKNDPRKLEIFDACFELGRACTFVGDVDDARRYLKRTKEGFGEQLGRDSEKALGATYDLTMTSCKNNGEVIDKMRDLLKRMERALGEENVVTLDTLNQLGIELKDIEDYQEAKELWERCLTGRTKMLGKDHTNTLMALNNLGCVYDFLKNTEKALEYYERALKGQDQMLGKTHPETLNTVIDIAEIYRRAYDFGKADELFERALEGYEAQFGRDHLTTKNCAMIFVMNCIGGIRDMKVRDKQKLVTLLDKYPHIAEKPEFDILKFIL